MARAKLFENFNGALSDLDIQQDAVAEEKNDGGVHPTKLSGEGEADGRNKDIDQV